MMQKGAIDAASKRTSPPAARRIHAGRPAGCAGAARAQPGFQLASFSVLTGWAPSPLRAPIKACHERIAHLTRAGYL